MKNWKAADIRARIQEVLPDGTVVPKHNERGHFYEINDVSTSGVVPPVYSSVTGRLQILKDEGLINYKMNRAIESLQNFMFANYARMTEENCMEMITDACTKASRVSQDILHDAGDIGTFIHDIREKIFSHWIATGERPKNFLDFIPKEEEDLRGMDVRAISATRALQKFCEERDYIPVACEIYVYDHELKTAGSLDDIGLIRKVLREEKPLENHPLGCPHINLIISEKSGKHTCVECDYQYRYEFVLMDLKSSNQFKDHYFFQVALYWKFFTKLTGLKPERCFILKTSKEDGSYKIEDLKKPSKLAEYARYMIKTNEGVDFIKSLRKDNQKVVAPLMQL